MDDSITRQDQNNAIDRIPCNRITMASCNLLSYAKKSKGHALQQRRSTSDLGPVARWSRGAVEVAFQVLFCYEKAITVRKYSQGQLCRLL